MISLNNQSALVKKNLLDLDYSKYLQYYNTLIIIISTYTLGIIAGVITKQINYADNSQLALIIFISIGIFSGVGLFLLSFKKRIRCIREEIKGLI